MRNRFGYKVTCLTVALAVLAAGASSGAAHGEEPHTFSGTITVPIYVPADGIPSFTLELEDQVVSSQDVVRGGVLVLTFSGSASEPSARVQSCPGHGWGARIKLIGSTAGTVLSATYTPTNGEPASTDVHVVPERVEHVTAAVCTKLR